MPRQNRRLHAFGNNVLQARAGLALAAKHTAPMLRGRLSAPPPDNRVDGISAAQAGRMYLLLLIRGIMNNNFLFLVPRAHPHIRLSAATPHAGQIRLRQTQQRKTDSGQPTKESRMDKTTAAIAIEQYIPAALVRINTGQD